MERGVDRAIHVDRDDAVEAALVQEADGIGMRIDPSESFTATGLRSCSTLMSSSQRQHRIEHDRADGRIIAQVMVRGRTIR